MSHKGTVTELRFEHGSSYKFYRVYQVHDADAGDFRVLYQWGRIGANGQTKTELFRSFGEMTNAALDKLNQKLNKGYEQSHHRDYDVVPPDVLRVAAVNERSRAEAEAKVSSDPFAKAVVQVDKAMRLATGTPNDQAAAVVITRSLHGTLTELRNRLTQLEGSVELVDTVLASRLEAR
jgi:predicted DNA-binding WGR domain protein